MTKYLKSKQHQQIIEFFDPDIRLPRNEKNDVFKLESTRRGTQPPSDSKTLSKWCLCTLGHYLQPIYYRKKKKD